MVLVPLEICIRHCAAPKNHPILLNLPVRCNVALKASTRLSWLLETNIFQVIESVEHQGHHNKSIYVGMLVAFARLKLRICPHFHHLELGRQKLRLSFT